MMAGDFNDTLEAADTSVIQYLRVVDIISEMWMSLAGYSVPTSPSSDKK